MKPGDRLPAFATVAVLAVVVTVIVAGRPTGPLPWRTATVSQVPPPPPVPVAAAPATGPVPAATGPLDTPGVVALLVDHSDPRAWVAVRADLAAASFDTPTQPDPWYANLTFVNDPGYEGMTAVQVLAVLDRGYRHSFAILVDRTALTSPEHPVLVLGVTDDDRGHTFRALPRTLQSIENNLSEANMDFEEFAGAAGEDGVFRGF